MTNRIERQTEAYNEALETCRLHGLDWRNHIEAMIKDKQIVGYYVIDETFSTAVARIML